MKTVTVHGVTYTDGPTLGARLETLRLWMRRYGVTEARKSEYEALAAAAFNVAEEARPLATVTPLFAR